MPTSGNLNPNLHNSVETYVFDKQVEMSFMIFHTSGECCQTFLGEIQEI